MSQSQWAIGRAATCTSLKSIELSTFQKDSRMDNALNNTVTSQVGNLQIMDSFSSSYLTQAIGVLTTGGAWGRSPTLCTPFLVGGHGKPSAEKSPGAHLAGETTPQVNGDPSHRPHTHQPNNANKTEALSVSHWSVPQDLTKQQQQK